MNINEIQELVTKAISENEIDKLLKGEDSYQMDTKRMPYAMPTDWESLLISGIHPSCDGNINALKVVKSGIENMLKMDAYDVWCIYNLYFYESYIARGRESIIFDSKIKDDLKKAIIDRKDKLGENNNFLTQSMWNDIVKMDDIIQRKFDGGIL